jgi:hypothetical protein
VLSESVATVHETKRTLINFIIQTILEYSNFSMLSHSQVVNSHNV